MLFQTNGKASEDTEELREKANSEEIITENAGLETELEPVAESSNDKHQVVTSQTVEASDNDKQEDVSSTDQINSEEDVAKKADIVNEDCLVDSTVKPEAKEVKLEIVEDCEEPVAKKAKFSEDEDKDDIFVETIDKSEEDYLADDSFADEVKDYH